MGDPFSNGGMQNPFVIPYNPVFWEHLPRDAVLIPGDAVLSCIPAGSIFHNMQSSPG